MEVYNISQFVTFAKKLLIFVWKDALTDGIEKLNPFVFIGLGNNPILYLCRGGWKFLAKTKKGQRWTRQIFSPAFGHELKI